MRGQHLRKSIAGPTSVALHCYMSMSGDDLQSIYYQQLAEQNKSEEREKKGRKGSDTKKRKKGSLEPDQGGSVMKRKKEGPEEKGPLEKEAGPASSVEKGPEGSVEKEAGQNSQEGSLLKGQGGSEKRPVKGPKGYRVRRRRKTKKTSDTGKVPEPAVRGSRGRGSNDMPMTDDDAHSWLPVYSEDEAEQKEIVEKQQKEKDARPPLPSLREIRLRISRRKLQALRERFSGRVEDLPPAGDAPPSPVPEWTPALREKAKRVPIPKAKRSQPYVPAPRRPRSPGTVRRLGRILLPQKEHAYMEASDFDAGRSGAEAASGSAESHAGAEAASGSAESHAGAGAEAASGSASSHAR